MLLDSAPGKRAGALAVSLGVQTLAAGTLLLIPLIYTDQLPFAQLQLPTFLPSAPPPQPPKTEPAPRARRPARPWRPLAMPTAVPPLDKRPEIIDDAPAPDFHQPLDLSAVNPPALTFTHAMPPPPTVHLQAAEPAPGKPVTVTSEIQAAKLIRKVIPVYPRLAVVARISGTVHLIGNIGKEGTIEQLQVVSGPPLLVQAAVDAVRQWLYRPTLLNGKPVEVIAPIDVIFTLSQ